MGNQLVLNGNFINLRALLVSDAEITFKWRQSQRAQFLNRGATTLEQQSQWIQKRPNDEYNFIIELKNSHPIGTLSLVNIDNINKHAEPGRFLIGDESAAKGIPAAVEAMSLLYDLSFNQLNLVRLWGIVAANNTLMIKWQKYMGMKEEGRLRNHLNQDGQFYDAVCLGLLVEEYRKTTLPRMKAMLTLASTVVN